MSPILAAGLFASITAPPNEAVTLATVLARFGTPAFKVEDYDFLDQHRCSSLPLIVKSLLSLPTIRPGKVGGDLGRPDDWPSNRTSELLRALRILTDHDEYGPITRSEYATLPVYKETPLGGFIIKRDSLLRGLTSGTSRYYGYWLSHGTSYYAPAATQRAIKVRWKTYVGGFDCRKKLSKRRWDANFFNG